MCLRVFSILDDQMQELGSMNERDSETLGQFYNITEAARRLHLAVPTLRRKVLDGEIICYRPSGFGRRILFSDEHLKEFVARHTYRAKEVEA